MKLNKFFPSKDEKPLEKMAREGGYCGIFRTIGCIGDSLASGEFESLNERGEKGYHDFFEYSWGQYIARKIGATAYNFSRGGMTAEEYVESFAGQMGYWDKEKACQAYIIALGVNDITRYGSNLGTTDDIDLEDYRKNGKTFAGYYATIIQKLKEIQPKAKFFLVTIPKSDNESERAEAEDRHQELLHEIRECFAYTYVIDLRKYAVVQDKQYKEKFFLGGHRNPMGYILMSEMLMSYIDFIIRKNMEDFAQVPFIGKDFHNVSARW